MAYIIAPHSIILVCEGDRYGGCGLDIGLGGSFCKDATALAECYNIQGEKVCY